MAHALHHHHHTGNEHNGGPVDTGIGLGRAHPEALLDKAAEVQRLPDGPSVMHAQAEHQYQHQSSAAQRYPLTRKPVPDDEGKHHNKNGNRQNFLHDSSSPFFRNDL